VSQWDVVIKLYKAQSRNLNAVYALLRNLVK